MRYVFLVLVISLFALSSDLGPSESSVGSALQPVIFAAAFGSQ